MRYHATPSTPPVRDAMASGLVDAICTPRQGTRLPEGATWCADNGCFGKGYPGDAPWIEWLASFTPEQIDRCRFAVAPDVVGDAAATLARSMPWLPKIRALGYPAAFVAQDGLESECIPWDAFDVLFIGGTTAWKLGHRARAVVTEAKSRGKWVHMGRVNSEKRLLYATAIGCDSADGTYVAFGPDQNLPRVLAWLRMANASNLFDLGALA